MFCIYIYKLSINIMLLILPFRPMGPLGEHRFSKSEVKNLCSYPASRASWGSRHSSMSAVPVFSFRPSKINSCPSVHTLDVLSPDVFIRLQARFFLLGFVLSTPITTAYPRTLGYCRIDFIASALSHLCF